MQNVLYNLHIRIFMQESGRPPKNAPGVKKGKVASKVCYVQQRVHKLQSTNSKCNVLIIIIIIIIFIIIIFFIFCFAP